jgi:hypothetical protein
VVSDFRGRFREAAVAAVTVPTALLLGFAGLGFKGMWQHYLIVLLIPVVIASRDEFDPVAWMLLAGLWLSPTETPHALWQTWLLPALIGLIAIRIATFPSRQRRPASSPQPATVLL